MTFRMDMMNMKPQFRKSKIGLAIVATVSLLTACGGGTGSATDGQGTVRTAEDQAAPPSSMLALSVYLPTRVMNLGIPVDVVATIAGETRTLNKNGDVYTLDVGLPLFREYALFLAAQRADDGLLLAHATTQVSTDANDVPLAVPKQLFSTAIDDDSDGFWRQPGPRR